MCQLKFEHFELKNTCCVNSCTVISNQKFKNARNLSQEEKKLYQEIRRQSHISAEQKRRGSIKQGFEHLQLLVVNPSSFPSGKVSKAVILEKSESQKAMLCISIHVHTLCDPITDVFLL